MILSAVVIRRMPLREHDQLVVLHGQETGRMAAIAKSSLRASSRQALALDEGNAISCALAPGRSDLPIVTGAQAQRCWSSAKADPLAWAVAQFFLQAIDAIVYDAQPDAGLWDVLVGTLEALDGGSAPLHVLRSGQAALLETLGYGQRSPASPAAAPCEADAEFDRIAQRHLSALDLVYSLAR